MAYEKSGLLLDRVKNIFFCVTEANKTPEIEAAEKEVTPLLTNFENEISFNQKFFERVKYVYDHERNSLKGEDKSATGRNIQELCTLRRIVAKR